MTLPWFSFSTRSTTKDLFVIADDYFSTTQDLCNASSLMHYLNASSIDKHLDYVLHQLDDPTSWRQGSDLFLLHATIRLLERSPHVHAVSLRWKLGPYWLMRVRQSESDWDAWDQMVTHMSLNDQALTLMQASPHPRAMKYASLLDRHMDALGYNGLYAIHRIQQGWNIPQLSQQSQTLIFNSMWRSACDRVRLKKEYPLSPIALQGTLDHLANCAKQHGFLLQDFKSLKTSEPVPPALTAAFSRLHIPTHVASLR